MKETFQPIGGATESPETIKFYAEVLPTEQKALEVFPESNLKKAIEVISRLVLVKKIEEAK